MKKLFTLESARHGTGPVVFNWSPRGNYLAVAGTQRKVGIYERSGVLYDEIHLPQPDTAVPASEEGLPCCIAVEWESQGDKLAVLQRGGTAVLLYTVATKEKTRVDAGLKDLTFMAWSKTSPVLAVGTGKGNLLLFNDRLGKKIPIMGKHTKRISCGAWSGSNKLALGSDDKHITISKDNGDSVQEIVVKSEPAELTFAESKQDDKKGGGQNTLSVILGRRTLYLYRVPEKEEEAAGTPLELAFMEQYGQILCHRWFGDGYVMLGFSSGYLVVVSTHNKELSEEVHSAKYHKDTFGDIAYSRALNRAATCGGNSVKVLDLVGLEFKELKSDIVDFESNVKCDKLQWTQDGQVLTVSTTSGDVHGFLASLPLIHSACGARMAYLTSLTELSIIDITGQDLPASLEVAIEPSLCALGPHHLVVAMNNQAWFYHVEVGGPGSFLLGQRDYLGSIQDVTLNSRHAALLFDGRVDLQGLSPDETGLHTLPDGHISFPEKSGPGDITSVALTESFLIFATKRGSIHYYFLDPERGPSIVNEYRHSEGGIRKVFPNALGTRLVFEDDRHLVFLYNPVNDQTLQVPESVGALENVLWDVSDSGVFCLVGPSQLLCYVYSAVTVNGPSVRKVGPTPRPQSYTPVILHHGSVTCQLKSGGLEKFTLHTYSQLQGTNRRSKEEVVQKFEQNLALLHLREAFDDALQIRSPEAWQKLTDTSLECMDVETAIRAYRHRGDAGMVLSLERVAQVEDKNLLAGYILLLQGKDYNSAQELFLKSSRPLAALEMRKDLKQWDLALKLARQLDPDSLGELSLQYAAQLEMRGEHQPALSYYERSISAGPRDQAREAAAAGGIARTTLQLGDIRRGKQLALESGNPQLCRECAAILEGINQMQDAAELYARGGQYEKAASIFIATKNFSSAQPLMAKITTPKLHIQFAKAKEAEGKFDAAATAYEAAGDLDNVVRLLLGPVNNPARAFALVRKARSADGAAMAAKYCAETGDHRGSIEFLILTKRTEEAFEVAQLHDEMDTYTQLVGAAASKEEFLRLARYYETKSAHGRAAELYERCTQHAQALKLYLRGATDADMEKAIEMVGRIRSDQLTGQLVDFLMSDTDGLAKRHTHLFRLHMALGNFEQAAKTAVLIARQEQEMGNYKVAHKQLLDTLCELQKQNKRPPSELTRQLMLLHSYILVKTLVKLGDHKSSARMLIRVARNISKFPAHIVPILTSTVIECQRSGLKKTAFEYASMLMRPEYRASIAPAYKKKIEDIVRKRDRGEEEEEAVTACPFCNMAVAETQLECSACKNTLPYCIATGRHMVLGDWTFCPSCKSPAIASELAKVVQAEGCCPACSQPLQVGDIQNVADPLALLKRGPKESSGGSEAGSARPSAADVQT